MNMDTKIRTTTVTTYTSGDIKNDFPHVERMLYRHAASDLIVFSETTLSGIRDEHQQKEILKRLQAHSRTHGIVIVIGIEERTQEGIYNAAYAFDKEKRFRYRKVHPVFDEVDHIHTGNGGFPVFDTSVGKLGMLICYDLIFPESARCLRLDGAQIMCLLARWTPEENKYFDILTKVRAKENWCYLIASDDAREGCGKSRIISPGGHVIARARRRNAFSSTTAEIDLAEVKELEGTRDDVNWMKRRRPSQYKRIVQYET